MEWVATCFCCRTGGGLLKFQPLLPWEARSTTRYLSKTRGHSPPDYAKKYLPWEVTCFLPKTVLYNDVPSPSPDLVGYVI